jgi:hypothetical protein
MKWYRRFTTIALALVLVAGVSCTNDTTGVDSPAAPETPAEPTVETSLLLGELLGGLTEPVGGLLDLLGGVVTTLVDVTGLLECSEQRYEVERETIGPRGGSIRVGSHLLVIPRGALTENVRITAEQMPGPTNSVRFSPHGLYFKKSAVLTMSYGNCRDVDLPKAIIYATEEFVPEEILRTIDLFRWRKVTAPIDHFSRYALAF